jgi:hypothetical protein
LLAGLGVIAWQTYQWLRYGEWPDFSVLRAFTPLGIPLPYVSWDTVPSVIGWWVDTPLSINLFILGATTRVLVRALARRPGRYPPA